MALKFYNTLTRRKEIFKPIKGKTVNIYSCGPTVYDFAHIGNFRSYVCADILCRYLRYKEFKVKQIMNITDVDDKTIKNSIKQNISLKEYTEKYTKFFFEDIHKLNIEKASKYPKATDHIKEMVKLIESLMKKGFAYKAKDNSIYFNIIKFKKYGRLALLDMAELKPGKRVKQDEYSKDHIQDFALWKAYSDEDDKVFWETRLGKGRPGWHIECSAMSIKYLGKSFDLHSGGVDLIFPHHQNEIAQSEASTNKKFVNYWLHNEFLLVDGKKMSKSLGNFYTLRDLLKKGYDAKSIRYLLLSSHYRVQLNFTLNGIDAAKQTLQRLYDFTDKLNEVNSQRDNNKIQLLIDQVKVKFEKEMDDDLNISNALARIFEFMTEVNKLFGKFSKQDADNIIEAMNEFDKVLGVLQHEKGSLDTEINDLIKLREQFRKAKKFKEADDIRNKLTKKGIILEDTKEGVRWKRI